MINEDLKAVLNYSDFVNRISMVFGDADYLLDRLKHPHRNQEHENYDFGKKLQKHFLFMNEIEVRTYIENHGAFKRFYANLEERKLNLNETRSEANVS